MASTRQMRDRRRAEREREWQKAQKVRAQRAASARAEPPPEVAPLGLLEFAYKYFPHYFYGEPAPFHLEIEKDLETTDRAVYAAPRGHSKSTLVSLAYPLWRAAYGRAHYVAIISDTGEQAADHVGNIFAELLENEPLVEDFPHLALPNPEHYRRLKVKRTTNDFITVGGLRFRGKGAGAGLRGMRNKAQRPDLIVVDDLENDRNVETPEQRKKLQNWFLKSVSNLFGASGGQLVVIGTVLHRKSLLAWLLSKEGPKVYTKRLYRALLPDGQPLWPAAWTLERLQKKREEIGSRAFSTEYLNEPVDEGSTLWKDGWLNANRRTSHPQLRRLAVAVDPSAGGNADLCGIVAGGVGDDKHGYTLEDNSLLASSLKWARVVLETYWRLNADVIIAEKNQGGDMVTSNLIAALKPGERLPPVKLVHAARGKAVRADPIATLDEQGKLHIVGELPKLEDELTGWTPGTYSPGRLDAYVWLWSELMLEPASQPPAVLTSW